MYVLWMDTAEQIASCPSVPAVNTATPTQQIALIDRISCAAGSHIWRGPVVEVEHARFVRQFQVCAVCEQAQHMVWNKDISKWLRTWGTNKVWLDDLRPIIALLENDTNCAVTSPPQWDTGKMAPADPSLPPRGWSNGMAERLR